MSWLSGSGLFDPDLEAEAVAGVTLGRLTGAGTVQFGALEAVAEPERGPQQHQVQSYSDEEDGGQRESQLPWQQHLHLVTVSSHLSPTAPSSGITLVLHPSSSGLGEKENILHSRYQH